MGSFDLSLPRVHLILYYLSCFLFQRVSQPQFDLEIVFPRMIEVEKRPRLEACLASQVTRVQRGKDMAILQSLPFYR